MAAPIAKVVRFAAVEGCNWSQIAPDSVKKASDPVKKASDPVAERAAVSAACRILALCALAARDGAAVSGKEPTLSFLW
jgi:hypothetical protein